MKIKALSLLTAIFSIIVATLLYLNQPNNINNTASKNSIVIPKNVHNVLLSKISGEESKKYSNSITTLSFSPLNSKKIVNIPLPDKVRIYNSHPLISLPVLYPGRYLLTNPVGDYTLIYNSSSKFTLPIDIKSCTLENDRKSCWLEFFQSTLFFNNDPLKAEHTIEKLSIEEADFSQNCHEYAHELGRSEVLLNKNLQEDFTKALPVCLSGFKHGLLEGSILTVSNQKLLKDLNTYCSLYTEQITFGCEHTLGHLVYLRTGSITKSVDLCKEILKTGDVKTAQGCADGVTMSYLTEFQDERPKNSINYLSPVKPQDPFKFCNTFTADQLIAGCLAQLNFFYSPITLNNEKYVMAQCLKYPTYSLALDNCFTSYGRLIATKGDLSSSKIVDNCSQVNIDINQPGYQACLSGAIIYSITSRQHSTDISGEYCQALQGTPGSEFYCELAKKYAKQFAN